MLRRLACFRQHTSGAGDFQITLDANTNSRHLPPRKMTPEYVTDSSGSWFADGPDSKKCGLMTSGTSLLPAAEPWRMPGDARETPRPHGHAIWEETGT